MIGRVTIPRKDNIDLAQLALAIKNWGRELGFAQVGIAGIDLGEAEARLMDWLGAGYHGEMDYMERHGTRRTRPDELEPGTVRIISARMDYFPRASTVRDGLADSASGYISRYALGRDYHKLVRKRLQSLATRIEQQTGPFGYRAFCDSAPVMEKAIAEQAGLGWIGKNTLLLNQKAGSWFFLGELYTNLPLPLDAPGQNHCGTCHACIDVCPTQALVAPYKLDARRCISYLTIEHRGAIPVELRSVMGNRVFGCDDCQAVCPWNRFARFTTEADFSPRHNLDSTALATLFQWSEEEFLRKTEGSPIRRTGYEGWLRNLAVALGNAPTTREVVEALTTRADYPSAVVREHVAWALERHGAPSLADNFTT